MATALGVLGMMSHKYAHRLPFIVKLNHNKLLTYPNPLDEVILALVEQAWNLDAVAVVATIYFGSTKSSRQIETSKAFARANQLGMATILWCYLGNDVVKQDKNYHLAVDLKGQANHLRVTIEAGIIKQKLPKCNGSYQAVAKVTKKNMVVWMTRFIAILLAIGFSTAMQDAAIRSILEVHRGIMILSMRYVRQQLINGLVTVA